MASKKEQVIEELYKVCKRKNNFVLISKAKIK